MSTPFPLPIVPVIDLRDGVVVRGVAGQRSNYQPIRSQLAVGCAPAAIAQGLVEHFAPAALYIADLDAIEQQRPNWNAYRQIAATGVHLWLDAGTGNACVLARLELFLAREKIAADVVIGLESISCLADWEDMHPRIDPLRTIFSVDLKHGRLLTQIPAWAEFSAVQLVKTLSETGLRRFILLDLAAVGTGNGVPTLPVIRQLRQSFPFAEMQWISGGGVASVADLAALAEAGADYALVASALHDGRLGTTHS